MDNERKTEKTRAREEEWKEKKKLKRSKRARGSGTIKQRRLLNRCTPLPRRFLVGERCNASSWGGYGATSGRASVIAHR